MATVVSSALRIDTPLQTQLVPLFLSVEVTFAVHAHALVHDQA
jgi:hypothetical protein